jgi:hypothetical protein
MNILTSSAPTSTYHSSFSSGYREVSREEDDAEDDLNRQKKGGVGIKGMELKQIPKGSDREKQTKREAAKSVQSAASSYSEYSVQDTDWDNW